MKWYVEVIDNDLYILSAEEAEGNDKAETLSEFLRNNLGDTNSSFYNYLHEYPVFGHEVEITQEEILPVLDRAEDVLNKMTKEEVYSELCQHDKLATFFKEEAKILIRNALIDKANSLLKQAREL